MTTECARVPMILCNAGYYGTVAAVRSLGRAGVPVVTVDTGILSSGRMSRYSNLHLRSPPFNTAAWSNWLLDFGRDAPRRAIYATSDAVSFALADRREELSSVFDLYQPDLDTMMCILDKGMLHKHAHAVGIDTPETWFPESANEADRVVRGFGGTIVAKPRSQLSVGTGVKGLIINATATNGRSVYDRLLRHNPEGLGAVVTGYQLHHSNDHSNDVLRLFLRLSFARRNVGLGPAKKINGLGPILADELKRVNAGEREPSDVMHEVLQRGSEKLGVPLRGYLIETTSLEALQIPPDVIRRPSLQLAIGVTHHKPAGAAWAQFAILVVYVDGETQGVSNPPTASRTEPSGTPAVVKQPG